MNVKLIISLSTVVVIAGLVFVARSNPRGREPTESVVASSKGVLSAQETSYNFNTVSMANGKVSHVFKLKNTGPETVTITKLYTSCMCTKASLKVGEKTAGPFGMPGHGFIPSINVKVEPGQEAEIEAVFDPNAHGPAGVGKIDRVVTVENNAGAPMIFQFSAMVTP